MYIFCHLKLEKHHTVTWGKKRKIVINILAISSYFWDDFMDVVEITEMPLEGYLLSG